MKRHQAGVGALVGIARASPNAHGGVVIAGVIRVIFTITIGRSLGIPAAAERPFFLHSGLIIDAQRINRRIKRPAAPAIIAGITRLRAHRFALRFAQISTQVLLLWRLINVLLAAHIDAGIKLPRIALAQGIAILRHHFTRGFGQRLALQAVKLIGRRFVLLVFKHGLRQPHAHRR